MVSFLSLGIEDVFGTAACVQRGSHPQGHATVSLVRPTGHVIAVAAITLSAILLLSACASPVEGLWPPSPGSPARAIIVSLDTWHAMIAFPRGKETDDSALDEPKQSGLSSPPGYQLSAIGSSLFEEWGYAERAWYLEGKTGVSGVMRALFWPTEGVVEVGRYDRAWAERTPQPPSDLFSFRLSEEGYQRLRQHFEATLLSEEPIASFGQSAFYPAKRSYHLFHTCHQYAALALRQAGLPISPFWAFNRTSLAWQLRRIAPLNEERQIEVPAVELR